MIFTIIIIILLTFTILESCFLIFMIIDSLFLNEKGIEYLIELPPKIRKRLVQRKFYKKTPCRRCIIVVLCKEKCTDFKTHYQKFFQKFRGSDMENLDFGRRKQ